VLFPLGDWQFWAVTASAAGAVWVLLRPFLASGERAGGGPCSHCGVAAGAPCQGGGAPRERLVTLGKGR
jgi:hypothetical protein